MGWEFAFFLIGALVLSTMLGMWQQGRYARSVNAMVGEHRGPDRLLVAHVVLGRLLAAGPDRLLAVERWSLVTRVVPGRHVAAGRRLHGGFLRLRLCIC